MPSAQDCAERLREQAYRTLLPLIRDLEQELQSFSSSLSAGVHQIGRKLEVLRNIELPTTEIVLGEMLGEVKLQTAHEASALVSFAHGLRQKETQEEILAFLLDGAQAYFPRVALFAVRGDRFLGWSSRGYSEEQAQNIGTCSFLRSECPQLEGALESERLITAQDFPDIGGPLHLLRKQAQEPWLLMPLRALQRPVALLLASGNESVPSRRDPLAILVEFTALRLENLALKILHDLTAARPELAPRPLQADAAIVAAPAAEPAAAPEPLPAIPFVPPAAAEIEVVEQEAAAAPEPEIGREHVEAPAAEAVPVVEPEEKPSFEMESPQEMVIPEAPPFEPVKAQLQEPHQFGDEEKLHTDAKRFARLLVSEIKLYNEHHVLEGRENRDLYIRLKRDIDRSREMYEKRVSPNVARKIDYFHDEIIRILGENDPSTLGSDYPGPRAES
jgi:hypothetical protein